MRSALPEEIQGHSFSKGPKCFEFLDSLTLNIYIP